MYWRHTDDTHSIGKLAMNAVRFIQCASGGLRLYICLFKCHARCVRNLKNFSNWFSKISNIKRKDTHFHKAYEQKVKVNINSQTSTDIMCLAIWIIETSIFRNHLRNKYSFSMKFNQFNVINRQNAAPLLLSVRYSLSILF